MVPLCPKFLVRSCLPQFPPPEGIVLPRMVDQGRKGLGLASAQMEMLLEDRRAIEGGQESRKVLDT